MWPIPPPSPNCIKCSCVKCVYLEYMELGFKFCVNLSIFLLAFGSLAREKTTRQLATETNLNRDAIARLQNATSSARDAWKEGNMDVEEVLMRLLDGLGGKASAFRDVTINKSNATAMKDEAISIVVTLEGRVLIGARNTTK